MNEYEAVDWFIGFRCDSACYGLGTDVLRSALARLGDGQLNFTLIFMPSD
jgi:hypothetical protein